MKRRIALFAAVILFATAFAGIALSDSSDATEEVYALPDDIRVVPSKNNMSLNAGSSETIYLVIYNNLKVRDLTVFVYWDHNQDSDVDVEFPNGHIFTAPSGGIESVYCEVIIKVDKYARSTDHVLEFDITFIDPLREGGPIEADAAKSLRIFVTSELSAGEQYGKILGFIDNHLPAPLNTPLVSAVITFFIWVFIAIIVAYFILPLVIRTGEKVGEKVVEDGGKIKRRLEK